MTTFAAYWFEQAGTSFQVDTSADYHCNADLYGVAVDFTGDDNLGILCASLGGEFARWAMTSRLDPSPRSRRSCLLSKG